MTQINIYNMYMAILPRTFANPDPLYNVSPLAYGFQNYEPSTSSIHNIFLINKAGQGIFGLESSLYLIPGNEVFTIKQSLAFWAPDDPDPRTIHGRTSRGDLSISLFTDFTTGSSIDLYGVSSSNPGQIWYTSNSTGAVTTTVSPYAPSMVFADYNGSAQVNNFVISADGHGIFGHGNNLSDIVNADVFTVNHSLGMWSANDADTRTIDGNTNKGVLSLAAKTDGTNGAAIGLYGTTSPYPGAIHLVSQGTTGEGMLFANYDGSAWHNNVQTGNNGQTVVGHDMDLSLALSTDVLTVKNIIGMYSSPDVEYSRGIHGDTHWSGLSLYSTTSFSDGSGIELWANASGYHGAVHFLSGATGTGQGFVFLNRTGGTYADYMSINNDGKVVIAGPGNSLSAIPIPGSYGLYVGNGILTEEVKVALKTGTHWSDFVFKKDYKLMPLEKVADFVAANNHLPDIPSAEDVKKEGIDLGSMDAKLLQKIEELTLYVIQQQKEIDELKKQVSKH